MEFVPQSITSYTSSQLTPEYANWSDVTTYIVGDKVIYGNYIWICSFVGSLNFEPKDNSPHWTKWGVSNYWSLIDPRSQTLTIVEDDLVVEFDKVGVETLVIGYFRGVSILVEVLNETITTETTIYSLTSHTDGYIYAGTNPNGKIFRSNNGITWTEVLDTTETNIRCLTSHTDGYIYAGTGAGGKIFRSNNGTTWTEVLDTTETTINSLTSHTDGYIYAGTNPNGKIFRSNNGTTWTQILDTTETTINSLTSHTDGYIYAGTGTGGKIFRSNNSTTWTEVLDTTEITIYSLTSHTDGYIYAGTGTGGKIFRSNNGTTWTEVLDTTETYILSLTSHTDGYIYAGTGTGGKIFRSNNGTTWTEVLDTTEAYIYSLTSHTDGYIYAGTNPNGKIFRSNNGITWTEVLKSGDVIGKLLYLDIFNNPRREGLPSYLNWIHAKFIDYSSRSKVFYLPLFGSKVRVTYTKGSYSNVQVGFMVGGRSTQMGKTIEGVKLGRTSYTIKDTDEFGITTITSRAKRKYHDFETSVNSDIAMQTLRIIENYEDVVMAFVIDNNPNSVYENIVTLGVYESVEPLATNNDKTVLSWTVIEMI